ncbi:peptide methionine sulfoxide reductase [bacterium SCGC AG-212-C10]|nr:peptide methionine sulfoxide reductase [bacterium SCGC AG-212-C10]
MTANDNGIAAATEVATFAGGCFWCLEAIYLDVVGVESVQSGYMGGHVENPSYEAVCTGRTGHAEVVQVTFDPSVIRYEDLVEVFFAIHDPTTLNRQGGDVGTQYRSAIYVHSPAQRASAESVIAKLTAEGAFPKPIVTEVTDASAFYQAEWYHDDYFNKNPNQGYCRMVIAPKVAKFRKSYAEKLKTVAAT